jgi:hypothetical protein
MHTTPFNKLWSLRNHNPNKRPLFFNGKDVVLKGFGVYTIQKKDNMKNYLMMLSLLWMLPLWAQQTQSTNIMRPQQTEPTAPTILDKEAADFFDAFHTAVKYIASKDIAVSIRQAYAQSFAAKFAEGAVIEVQNGRNKKPFRPIDYFNRLIDLKYEVITIRMHVETKTPFRQDAKSWWTSKYTFSQFFIGKSDGKKIVKDYTIKTIGLHFLYTPATNTWTKKYGHVLVDSVL